MQINEQKLNAFVEQAIGDLAAGYGGVMVNLGRKLGLYKALAGAGPLSSHQLARRAQCAERYVREWLNSQAAAGYVVYHPTSETYELTPEQALVLADETSPLYIPPAWEVPASMWFDEAQALEAFRTGKGVPWGAHDSRLFCGVAAFYRNGYRANLVQTWIPALEGVQERLQTGALVADVGCGHGHSTVILAEAFPNSRFLGFDPHPDSVAAAEAHAREAGVADRVSFQLADAQSYVQEDYDLVCFFDCLHDMGDPVGAARYARQSLKGDGSVMLVEPFAHDKVEQNLNTVGRLYYSASTTLCTAHALSEVEGSLALGAQAGKERLAAVFEKAGFGTFTEALSTPFNLILQARP